MKRILACALVGIVVSTMLFNTNVSAQQSATSEDRAKHMQRQDVAALVPENEVYSLPWETIREEDILWKKRVWRDIDAAKEINDAFAPGSHNLAGVLLSGAQQGKLVAYEGKDGRFLKKVDVAELQAITGTPAVKKYQVKEDWLYVASKKMLVVRIVGIAPVVVKNNADGNEIEEPLFWIYYPDAREYLTQFKATDGFNWDQFFQSRKFGSKITSIVDSKMPH